MGTVTDRHFIAHMMWDEVARHIANGAAAILPPETTSVPLGITGPVTGCRVAPTSA